MKTFLTLWSVLAMMAPWLLGGFLLAGLASVWLPKHWVEKRMGSSRGWRGVLNAVLIGVPLPICSCGVLPLTAELRKEGAGKGASAAFLISTPQTGIDSVLATYSLMGPVFALARPLAAFLTGLLGGIVVDLVARDGEASSPPPKKSCHCCCCHGHADEAAGESQGNKLSEVFRKADDLLGEIARPLLVGLVIATLVTAFIPENFFAGAFGGRDWLAMPAMVLIGFPMYVCSTAAIPIALSLVLKGLSPGAAFVFLMVGPAINAASLTTVAQLIGRGATIAYALVIGLGAIACGVVMNLLPFVHDFAVSGAGIHENPSLIQHAAAGLLVLLIARKPLLRIIPVKAAS